MKYGRYEVKKVEHSERMSEETTFFALDLYVDGRKFAAVSNDGRGGCHRVHPYPPFTHEDVDRVEGEMRADKFLVHTDFDHERFDEAVSTLLEAHLTRKDLMRKFRSEAVFVSEGELLSTRYRDKKAPDEALFAHVEKTHPGAILLNRLPPDEAAKAVVELHRAQEAKLLKNNDDARFDPPRSAGGKP